MPAEMAGKLDTSLDDIINEYRRSGRENEHSGSNGRGGGRSSYCGVGPHRRFLFHNAVRSPQMQILKPSFPETVSESDPEAGTKLYVSNLDYGVSDYDLEILFSEVGDLRRHSIHYDKRRRSKPVSHNKCTAEIVFVRGSDAIEAMKRYHSSMLDQLVGMDFISPAFTPLPPISNSILGNHQAIL